MVKLPRSFVFRLVDTYVTQPECTKSSLEQFLNTANLTLEQVENVDILENVEPEALASGSLDVAISGEPWITRAEQAGQGRLWVSGQEIIPDFQFGVILYGPTLLEENPEAGQRFMAANLRAVRQLNEGKTERNIELMIAFTKLDRELVEQICWPAIRSDGQINSESILAFQDWAVSNDYLDDAVTVEQFWDPSFIEYANEVLDAPAD